MREAALWSTAICFLLAATFTVSVRREVYEVGRRNGRLEDQVLELRRRNDNAQLRRERLASPAAILERARAAELWTGAAYRGGSR